MITARMERPTARLAAPEQCYVSLPFPAVCNPCTCAISAPATRCLRSRAGRVWSRTRSMNFAGEERRRQQRSGGRQGQRSAASANAAPGNESEHQSQGFASRNQVDRPALQFTQSRAWG